MVITFIVLNALFKCLCSSDRSKASFDPEVTEEVKGVFKKGSTQSPQNTDRKARGVTGRIVQVRGLTLNR